MFRVFLIGAAALAVAGCDKGPPPESDLIVSAKAAVVRDFKDPSSAQFRDVHAYPDRNLVCGEVNGKNSFGAYTGFEPFFYDNGYALIASVGERFLEEDRVRCVAAVAGTGAAALSRAEDLAKTLPEGTEKQEILRDVAGARADAQK